MRENFFTYKSNICILIKNNKIEITRVSPDYEVDLVFEKDKETESMYKFVGGDKVFHLKTQTKVLEITKNKIIIEYVLEDNEFSYTLEMEDL